MRYIPTSTETKDCLKTILVVIVNAKPLSLHQSGPVRSLHRSPAQPVLKMKGVSEDDLEGLGVQGSGGHSLGYWLVEAFVFFLGLAGREVAVQRAPQSEYLGGLAMKQLTIVLLTYLPSAADSSADPVMGRMSKNHCAYGLRNGGR